ncbi:MAG: DUF86 domain-containing protein [Thermodesulfobacteriota bacterium]|nr:DUF86 domain-containing protein [Thermodesulfobacteriota bacterium]
MSLSPPEYIRHMLDEIDYILSRISDTDYESFVRDETLKRPFVRSIEVIGEASKKLSKDIKSMQPDVEWRKVSGMRDRLIHDYFGVDYTIVWDVVSSKLPDLRIKLHTLPKQIQQRHPQHELGPGNSSSASLCNCFPAGYAER